MTSADDPSALKSSEMPCLRAGRSAAGADQNKRDQILSGAHRIFSRNGYDAASMNDITREAQVSKGTIYVYFANKEDLFEALIERERSVLFSGVESALEVPGQTADKLRNLSAAIIKVLCSDTVIKAHRIVIGVTERMPAIGLRFFDRGAMRTTRMLATFLSNEVAEGRLIIPDTQFAAAQFVELSTAGLFRRRLFGQMADPPSEAEITRNATVTVDMFLSFYTA